MTTPVPDLLSTFVHLRSDGSATSVPWTPDIWRTLALADGDRIVGARRGEMPTDFHPDMWEMHPHGDELLSLLSGAIDAVFDEPGGERVMNLRGGQTCIVPRGVWHRLILREPSDLMFVTPAAGTQLRPIAEAR
jgi:mannose-6-phosphate isomerase-like protein (cupin superfamily)